MGIPRSMKINGWDYEVREYFGNLEMCKYGGPIEYKTVNPMPVLHPNIYHVCDLNGNKVGEFDTNSRSCSGCVNSIEM
jgi:hypothetical protein